MLDRITDKISCDKVIIDDFDTIYNEVKSLVKMGRKKIGFITAINNLNVGKLRTKGYQAAIRNKQDTIIVEGSEEHLEKELSSLIKLNKETRDVKYLGITSINFSIFKSL